MNLLLIGNHTCGNRGDAAILRGLLEEIERQHPGTKVTVTSRYPISSAYLLGHPTVSDPFHIWHKRLASGLMGKIKNKVSQYAVPTLMMRAIQTQSGFLLKLLPKSITREVDALHNFDAVIQVGGSFFVDLYGYGQFEYPFAALLAKKPLFLIGHSMGPCEGRLYRRLMATLLSHSDVALREPVSRQLLAKSELPLGRLTSGGDTAWLVDPRLDKSISLKWLDERVEKRPVVAITVRELAPFDKRLNTTQLAYETAVAKLVNQLIADGYDVLAASTCTGIDSYHRDDRMNALSIGANVREKEHYHVVMDELNDFELGLLFRRCELVIGTRLHSAIISMNFGTPAIAINYEHKSLGIMQQLDMPTLSQPVSALLDGSLIVHVRQLLPRIQQIRNEASVAVANERTRTATMVSNCLKAVAARH